MTPDQAKALRDCAEHHATEAHNHAELAELFPAHKARLADHVRFADAVNAAVVEIERYAEIATLACRDCGAEDAMLIMGQCRDCYEATTGASHE